MAARAALSAAQVRSGQCAACLSSRPSWPALVRVRAAVLLDELQPGGAVVAVALVTRYAGTGFCAAPAQGSADARGVPVRARRAGSSGLRP